MGPSDSLSVRDLRVTDCNLAHGDIPEKREGNHIGARKLRNHEPGVLEAGSESPGDERWIRAGRVDWLDEISGFSK